MIDVWTLAHDPVLGNQLAAAARTLGASVGAVSIGAGPLSAADLTVQIEVEPGALAESYAGAVADLLRVRGATVVLAGDDVQSRLLAGAVAGHLGVSPFTITSPPASDPLQVTELAFGGLAVATEQITADVAVFVIGHGVLPVVDALGEGLVEDVVVQPQPGMTLVETRPKGGESVDLTAAKRVVGVGRGFAAQPDLGLAEDVASRLGAEIACSRPIAEGVGWLPAERYLGVSGATVRPDLYLAVGISGQVQHMVGVHNAKVIVAINSDKNAPIFEQADFGVVGDLYKVLPELAKNLG